MKVYFTIMMILALAIYYGGVNNKEAFKKEIQNNYTKDFKYDE